MGVKTQAEHRAEFVYAVAKKILETTHDNGDNGDNGAKDALIDWLWEWFRRYPVPRTLTRYRLFLVVNGQWLPIFDYPSGHGFLEYDTFHAAQREAEQRAAADDGQVVVVTVHGYATFEPDSGAQWVTAE